MLAAFASTSAGLGTLVASPQAAAAQSPTAVFFVDANGTLNGYGSTAQGAWSSAVPIGPAGLAPPGAPVAAAVTPGGVAGAFVAGDGAVHVACWPGLVMVKVSLVSFTPGSQVAISAAGGRVTIAILDQVGREQTIMQDSHDPCTNPHLPPFATMSQHSVPWYNGAPIAMTTLTDGSVGVFTSDQNAAVHGVWLSSAGVWSDYLLTPDGATGANGGIAVAPRSAASTTPGALRLFYPGSDARIYVARPAENGGLVGDPNPQPWGSSPISSDQPIPRPWGPVADPWGVALDTTATALLTATAALAGESDVSYVADNGSVVDLSTDGNGNWLSATTVTAAGFASPGAPIASSTTAADAGAFDDFCGTGDGRLYHLPIGPNGPGPGGSAGPNGLLATTTQLGAA